MMEEISAARELRGCVSRLIGGGGGGSEGLVTLLLDLPSLNKVNKAPGQEGASPDLRRGRAGAEPGVAEEADGEGWTEKSETWSVSLISLRTLLAR